MSVFNIHFVSRPSFFSSVGFCSAHFYPMLHVQNGSIFWCEIPVCPLYVALQSTVILFTPGESVVCRDLLPCLVVWKWHGIRFFVLKKTLQVSLSQLCCIVHSEGIKALLLFLNITLPERKLQVTDLGAAVFAASAQKTYNGSNNYETPAQNLQM